MEPSSMLTGKCTISSRAGYRKTFQSPSSRFSFCAAKSNRAAWASQGLISCSRVSVCIAMFSSVPVNVVPSLRTNQHGTRRQLQGMLRMGGFPLPGVERVPREKEYPHESGQTHEYRLAEDASTTRAVCDSGTPIE